tara:strand:- start:2260 stop:3006 length:747 start_codon:yes stop_codon:yes gene_type:complete
MKKIVWIDVGTHFAQEHSSIFGSNLSLSFHILKRFIGSKFLARRKFVSIKELRKIIILRNKIRKYRLRFFSIFIEANSKIVHEKNNYANADLTFNLALTDNSEPPFSIMKLYLGNRDKFSQGSSLFLEKENVYEDSFIPAISIPSSDMFKVLEKYLSQRFDNYVVLLRLNCEGVEDEVIYSAYESFGIKLKLLCGSLKDVKSIKGDDSLEKLKKFMSDMELEFQTFHSRADSWLKPYSEILKLVENIN